MTNRLLAQLLIYSNDFCAQFVESLINSLISSVDLADVLDLACPLRTEGSDQHGDTGTDVGRYHVGGPQAVEFAGSDHNGAVGIA